MFARRHPRGLDCALLTVLGYATIGAGLGQAKKTTKEALSARSRTLPEEGCGTDFDSNLNRLKNIRSDDPRAAGSPETKGGHCQKSRLLRIRRLLLCGPPASGDRGLSSAPACSTLSGWLMGPVLQVSPVHLKSARILRLGFRA